jgi:hypothetical protein
MTEIKNTKVQSKFKTLELVSFKVEERNEKVKVDPQHITYEISINFSIDKKRSVLNVNCAIKVFAEIEKSNLLGSIETKAEFNILNLPEIMNEKKGLEASVLATFIGLLISTTRGMLSILSKGTSFEGGIIPIINPMVFFQERNLSQVR